MKSKELNSHDPDFDYQDKRPDQYNFSIRMFTWSVVFIISILIWWGIVKLINYLL